MNKKYESLSKNALKCMRIASIFGNLFLGALIIAGYLFLSRFLTDWIWILLGVIVLVISVLDIFVVAPIRFRRYQYAIDEECIDIMEGFLFLERDLVPIERLHKIAIMKGPIDRFCGVAKVRVTTAGGDVTIRFLDDEKAEFIADSLKKRVNEIVRTKKSGGDLLEQ